MDKPVEFEIILGTYEEFVVGYRFHAKDKNNYELTQSFATHSHYGSVRCVAHSEYYLASGGADDRIVIYDLKDRKEHCLLTHHNSTVNCLQFTDGHTHLITGGSDGVLAIVRVGNWQLEKKWEKAHKGASIIDIAIHSSSKLALTLGADCTLRTWNLIKGRQAYVINLNSKFKDPKSLQFVRWAPDGVRFVLCGGRHTDIWSIESGGVIKSIEHENKVSYCLFYHNDVLVVSFENGELIMLNLNEKNQKQIQAHSARIKSLDICKGYIVTCSSDGEVKVWNKDLEKVASCNTDCRHTCICVVESTWVKKEEKDIAEEESESLEINVDESLCEDKIVKKKEKNIKLLEEVEEEPVIRDSKKRQRRSDSSKLSEDSVMHENEMLQQKKKKFKDQRRSNELSLEKNSINDSITAQLEEESSIIRDTIPKKKKKKKNKEQLYQ